MKVVWDLIPKRQQYYFRFSIYPIEFLVCKLIPQDSIIISGLISMMKKIGIPASNMVWMIIKISLEIRFSFRTSAWLKYIHL